LVGALVWVTQTIILSIELAQTFGGESLLESAKKDPAGLLSLVGYGWLAGLTLTVVIGLPLGFLVAFLLRRTSQEGLVSYCVAGTATAFAFSMLLPGRSEFWLAITVTGFVLGLCYWLVVRRSALQTNEMQ
jgi:NhaP-type Na+/H+ and K+/H+ antiporter